MALLLCLALLAACKSSPPVVPVMAPASPPPLSSAVEVRVDDIPADAPSSIRAHLIKLREMRDVGEISESQYQSRKAGLLGR